MIIIIIITALSEYFVCYNCSNSEIHETEGTAFPFPDSVSSYNTYSVSVGQTGRENFVEN